MICLGNEWESFCLSVLKFYPSTAFQTLIDYEGYSVSSKGFSPTVVGIMSSELKSPVAIHFSSLTPKMSVFTLSISCLSTFNLPWFVDLTFQVLVWHCPIFTALDFTFTTRHPQLGTISALTLPLYSSRAVFSPFPSSVLGTYWPGGLIFWCRIFLPFHTVLRVLKARILKGFAIPFSSGPCFVRTVYHGHRVAGGWPTAWEQLYQRSSCPDVKVLGPRAGFPTWG